MASSISKQYLRTWLRLLSCSHHVEQVLRARLRATYDITLPQFDVLAELERAGGPLTMSELSRRLLVTNGNITGVIDRLEKQGYVRRVVSKSDRRVQNIELLPTGSDLFKEVARSHEQWVAEMFGGMLEREATVLFDVLGRAKKSIQEVQVGK